MRKILVLIILLGLILSMTISVYALDNTTEGIEKTTISEPEISKEKAIELAKKTIKTGWGYNIYDKKHAPMVEFVESYSPLENGEWLVNWRIQNDEIDLYIDVVIDALTGMTKKAKYDKYVNGSFYSDNNEEIELLTNEEAKVIAEKFIKKIDPNKYKEVELTLSRFDMNYDHIIDYEYYFDRKVNGARVNRNYIFVTIDGRAKEVTQYFCRWDDDDFPHSTNIISKDEAMKIIKENMQLSLEHLDIPDCYQLDEEYQPIYTLNIKNAYAIDAKEGMLIDLFGDVLDTTESKDITDQQKEEIYTQESAIASHEKEISQDKAAEIMKKYIKDIYGEGYNIGEVSYFGEDYQLSDKVNRWTTSFSKQNESREIISIEIDALTERLLHTTLYDRTEKIVEEKASTSWEAGYDKAIEIISKYYPEKIKNIETEMVYGVHPYDYEDDQELEYQYIFPRIENGAIYKKNNITVTLGAKDQSVKAIWFFWQDIELPENENIISKTEAEIIYLEGYEPELIYLKFNKSKDINSPEWEIKLTYAFPYEYYVKECIDAVTGGFLDQYGSGIEEKNSADPEGEVTRIQAIKILLDETDYSYNYGYYGYYGEPLKFTNINYEDEDYEYIEMAVDTGLIENKEGEFKGKEKVTREELAEMIVNLLDYDDLAKKNDMYKVSFSDSHKISKDKVGCVAICSELGILKAEERKFRPKDIVKNIEIAIAISNMSKYLD